MVDTPPVEQAEAKMRSAAENRRLNLKVMTNEVARNMPWSRHMRCTAGAVQMAAAFIMNHDALLTAAILMVAMISIAEGGYRLGRREKRGSEQEKALGVIEGALLTLLALLLAFGISMAQTRFEARVQHLLQETKAIGTAYLRCDLAVQAIRDPLKAEIRKFLDARIEFYVHPFEDEGLLVLGRRTEQMENRIWNLTTRQVLESPRDSGNIPLVNGVSDMLDARAEQDATFHLKLPESISYLLLISSALVVGIVAYGYGLVGKRHFAFTIMLSIVVASSLFVFLDLDRPRKGLIRIPADPLVELKAAISK
jgi:hypothetical protein